MLSWTPADVQSWLFSLGEGYKKYEEAFKDIDGPALFELEEEVLKDDFGITNKLHLKRILRAKNGQESLMASKKLEVAQDLKKITSVTIDLKKEDEGLATQSVSICRRTTDALTEKGIAIDPAEPIAAVFKGVDDVLSHAIHQRIPLDTAECITNLVIMATAQGSPGLFSSDGDSIMKTSKEDHAAIQNAQVATRSALIEVKTLVQKLSMHVQAFSDGMAAWESAVTKEELLRRKVEISQAVETFADDLNRISENMKQGGEDMLARSQKQMMALTAGSKALEDAIRFLAVHTKVREEAQREYRELREKAIPDVELAFEARAGTLKKRRDSILSEIEDLCMEKARMETLVQDQDTIVAQHEKFVLDVNRKDQELRDWHIRFCWANSWGPEMDRYRQQADRAIASHKSEKDRAEALKQHYHAQIEDVRQIIKKMNDRVQEMNTLMAEHGGKQKEGWRCTLESFGVLALEDRMNHAKENVEKCEGMLRDAMRQTGICDPEGAAKAILLHHQCLSFIADAAIKGRLFGKFIKGLNELLTTYVNTNFNNVVGVQKFACRLRLLPKGLAAIEEFHAEQEKKLDVPEERFKIITGYLERMHQEFEGEFMPAIQN